MMVGYLMVSTVTEIRFDEDNMAEAILAYLAIVAMPLFYSISEGISMGIISHVVLHVLRQGQAGQAADVCWPCCSCSSTSSFKKREEKSKAPQRRGAQCAPLQRCGKKQSRIVPT